MKFNKALLGFSGLAVSLAGSALADEPLSDIEKIRINGQQREQPGAYISASQGWVDGQDLIDRPMLRTGEMLEFIPGMMVTQHSGSGKANQYFLRGFNLAGEHLGFNRFVFGNTQHLHGSLHAFTTKPTEKLVFHRHIKLGKSRISLTSRSSSELIIDTS